MLQRLGLYDRFAGAGGKLGAWVSRVWEGGPDKLNGCLVAGGNRPPEFISDARQVWEEVPTPHGSYWIGLENAQTPPGPQDLVNPVNIDGHFVRLGDGNDWRIPLIWRWDAKDCTHVIALPRKLTRRIVEGRVVMSMEVISGYEPLVAIAARVWDSYINQTPISLNQLFDDAAMLLGMNYRIGAAELSLLGLVDEQLVQKILSAAIDLPMIVKQCEENLAAGLLKCEQVPDRDEMALAAEVKRG